MTTEIKLAYAEIDIVTTDGERIKLQFTSPKMLKAEPGKVTIAAGKVTAYAKIPDRPSDVDAKQELLTKLRSLPIAAKYSDEVQILFNQALGLWLETKDNKWFQEYLTEHHKHPQSSGSYSV